MASSRFVGLPAGHARCATDRPILSAQIVKVQAFSASQASLLVTDWTEHALITERYPPLPDAEVVNVEEPFGRYVLEVQVLHPGLLADRDFLDALAPGAVVRLSGLMLSRTPNASVRGHLTKSHSSAWERVREESQEHQVLALLRCAQLMTASSSGLVIESDSFSPLPTADGRRPTSWARRSSKLLRRNLSPARRLRRSRRPRPSLWPRHPVHPPLHPLRPSLTSRWRMPSQTSSRSKCHRVRFPLAHLQWLLR